MALFRFSPASDPVSGLLDLQRELDRFFQNPLGFDLGVSSRGVFPAVNIFSDKDGYIARLEVPGVSPEQINIESHGRTLTISGKREVVTPENGSFHRRERESGAFSRSLQLPDDLDPARAQASYKHGILTVRIPKKEEAKPRQITVNAA
jgi:HSP20 family protein